MKQKNTVWKFTEMLLVAGVLALVIRMFIVSAYKIPSGSMLQTLQIGDYLLVTRFNYDIKVPFTDISIVRTGDPDYDEIIVFRPPHKPGEDYIKRIVGKPGDIIEVRNKMLFRNGQLVTEPYTQFVRAWPEYVDNVGPVTVPEDHYYVMGDNRDASEDSRVWGTVARDSIRGKAWVIYWSWDGEKPVNAWYQVYERVRWSRLGTILYPGRAGTDG